MFATTAGGAGSVASWGGVVTSCTWCYAAITVTKVKVNLPLPLAPTGARRGQGPESRPQAVDISTFALRTRAPVATVRWEGRRLIVVLGFSMTKNPSIYVAR